METNITIIPLSLFISLDSVQCTINRIKPVTTYGNQHHHLLLALFISLDCVQCTINRIEPVTTYGNQHHHQLLGSFYLFRLCPMYNKQNRASYNIWKPTSPSTPISFYLFRLCPMCNKQNRASYNIWKPTSPSTPWLFLSL